MTADELMDHIEEMFKNPDQYDRDKLKLAILGVSQGPIEIPMLIEALKKEYPFIRGKVDIITEGVSLRKKAMLLLKSEELSEDALKDIKLRQGIYDKAVEINDSIAKQISNVGGETISMDPDEIEQGSGIKKLKVLQSKEKQE